jgi:capsular exopolysaccharide synthesis family protein
MEQFDFVHLLKRLSARWYLFAASVTLMLVFAVFYLASTPDKYLVVATIQLKDKGVGEKAVSQEEFLSGVEFLGSAAEVEDEVGILTSYSLMKESLKKMPSTTQIFRCPTFFGMPLRAFRDEVFPPPFDIRPDSLGWQVMDCNVDIAFLPDDKIKVNVESDGDHYKMYNTLTAKTIVRTGKVKLDTTFNSKDTLKTSFLHLIVRNVDPELVHDDKQYFFRFRSLEAAAQNLEGRLTTSPISANANIIRLSLISTVPSFDIASLQNLCNVYIEGDLHKKNMLGERTIDFIDFQLQGVTDSLHHAESTLESFRNMSNIIDVGVTSQSLAGRLNALEEQQALLSVQSKYYKFIAKTLAKGDVSDIASPSSVGIQDQLLSNLILQLTEMNQEKIGRAYNSRSSNPAYQVLEQKIAASKKALNESIQNLIGSNEIAMEGNTRRIEVTRAAISRLPHDERSLTDIRRKFNFNDNIYNYLLQKRAEAGIAIASNVPDKRVIDYPRQMKRVGPNAFLIVTLALMMGIFLPTGFIFAQDFLHPKMEHVEQLSMLTELPLLESVALISSSKNGKAKVMNNGYLAHSFRFVRQQIINLARSKNVKTIGITSSMSGEGKTFSTYNLAVSLAAAGQKVLVVDLDLHQRKLGRLFKVNALPGVSDYFANGKNEIIQNTHVERLDIITAGTPFENPSDLINEQRLDKLLMSLREKYDCIIFDTPPLGIIPDFLAVSKLLDYTIIVVRNEFSSKASVRRANKLIEDHALPAGIIYNGVKVGAAYGRY